MSEAPLKRGMVILVDLNPIDKNIHLVCIADRMAGEAVEVGGCYAPTPNTAIDKIKIYLRARGKI